MVNAWKTQYIISGWLHTPYQTIFIVIYWIFKISSLFDHYLWNSPVKRGGQPHGSDQCGYIHLLYRFIFCFTVVGVEHLCRLGCTTLHSQYQSCISVVSTHNGCGYPDWVWQCVGLAAAAAGPWGGGGTHGRCFTRTQTQTQTFHIRDVCSRPMWWTLRRVTTTSLFSISILCTAAVLQCCTPPPASSQISTIQMFCDAGSGRFRIDHGRLTEAKTGINDNIRGKMYTADWKVQITGKGLAWFAFNGQDF